MVTGGIRGEPKLYSFMGQIWGKKVQNFAKHRKEPHPSVKWEKGI